MAFAINSRRTIAALLAIVATAVLYWFGNGLDPLWPLPWFAPLPVLLFALRSSWWSAAGTAFLSLLLGNLNLWHYLHLLGIPPSGWFGIFSIVAIAFAVAVLLFRALLLRGAPWSALLAFPAVWVGYEYARNCLTPHGTAGSTAHSQLKFLPFLQLASITGPWGMSFLLMLFPAALTIGLYLRQSQPKQAVRIVGASLSVIALVLFFGGIRLMLPSEGQQVKAGLITSDTPENVYVASKGAKAERLFHDYAAEAEKLAARGAQVIVLPEKLAVVDNPDNRATDAIFQALADKTGAMIVVGSVYVIPPAKYNRARVYAPGAAVTNYDKQHMLPPFESNLKPGTALTILPKSSQTWGVAICKDMDFTPLSREYGRAGAGLMLVPGWDFNIDRAWHGHIAVMRGVESGFSVVRAAKNGYLTVSDSRGRIVGEARSDSAPFVTLLAEVPATHYNTLYLLLGDWFAWLALALFVLTIMQLFRIHNNRVERPDRTFAEA